MILLRRDDHSKVAPLLDAVPFNTLFARAVLEGRMDGRIYVDDVDSPGAACFAHAYGMSLLAGLGEAPVFTGRLKDYLLNANGERTRPEWLQVSPDTWCTRIQELLGSRLVPREIQDGRPVPTRLEDDRRVVEYTRVNFEFSPGAYREAKASWSVGAHEIVRTDERIGSAMLGSVTPLRFWRDAADFSRNGVGFTLLHHGEVACTAFSSFVQGDQLELGIETVEKYRGMGFAVHACSALIDHCLDHDLLPVWACRLENTASYRLAQKLGFRPSRYLPYYRLVTRS